MWMGHAFPPPAIHSAIEHARRFDGTAEERMAQASFWKGQGVLPGISDYMLWARGKCVAVELKWGRNTPTEAEKAFGCAMIGNGFDWFPAWSVAEVDARMREIFPDLPRSMSILAMEYDAALSVRPAPKRASRRWDRLPTGEQAAEESAKRLQDFLDDE
jgi:hypothetical protein